MLRDMKKIIVFIVFTIAYSGISQTIADKKPNFWASYRFDYKKFETSESALSENTILIVNNQGSLFTFEAMMNLDKIQQDRKLTLEDAFLYKSPFYYVIKSDGTSTTHYEEIGNDWYQFQEKQMSNWKLINKDTLISGYTCKKAIINYTGREWTAWYTTKIPVSFGPYKFNGLPGLILNISDSEHIFNFTINEIKTGNFITDSKVANYFINDAEDQDEKTFEPIKSEEFYAIRTKFNQMSLDEKLRFMNRGGDPVSNFVATDLSGERINTNRNPKLINFIERSEKK